MRPWKIVWKSVLTYSFASSIHTRGLFGHVAATCRMLFLAASMLALKSDVPVSVGGYMWFLSTIITQFEGVWSRKYWMYSGW